MVATGGCQAGESPRIITTVHQNTPSRGVPCRSHVHRRGRSLRRTSQDCNATACHDSTPGQPADGLADCATRGPRHREVDGCVLQAATGKGAWVGPVPAGSELFLANGVATDIIGWAATTKFVSAVSLIPVLCWQRLRSAYGAQDGARGATH